jgi:hypothetical protein
MRSAHDSSLNASAAARAPSDATGRMVAARKAVVKRLNGRLKDSILRRF